MKLNNPTANMVLQQAITTLNARNGFVGVAINPDTNTAYLNSTGEDGTEYAVTITASKSEGKPS